MSEFKRSPSKVWWGNDNPEWREASSSPGSQDSGFSDIETSPNIPENVQNNKNAKSPIAQRVPKDLFKSINSDRIERNLKENVKQKLTPEKVKINDSTDRLVKSESKAVYREINVEINVINTDPIKKHRYTKHSPKVSRNLFQAKQCKDLKNPLLETHQYAKFVADQEETSRDLNTSEEVTIDDSYSVHTDSDENFSSLVNISTQSLPVIKKVTDFNRGRKQFHTAPDILEQLEEYEGVTSFNNSLSSDSESELEDLFNQDLESPQHTSTPKGGKMCHRRETQPFRLLLKYQHQRQSQHQTANLPSTDDNSAQRWLEEIKNMYEQECMTTLQSKSIAAELNQKVSNQAAVITTAIRSIISHSKCIEREYENLNGEVIHIDPLIQSLTGNILDFLKTFTAEVNSRILRLCDQIKASKSESSLSLVSVLFSIWNDIRQDLLNKEVKILIDRLENPNSELTLRAVITGITSISLRNEELVELFTKADVIPILLILCEKCEGSSLRSLLLRALTTMCCNALAVKHFEKFSGIQIIADTLDESSRPEPEKSEAVALLAQITAPWLEDNHSVRGLQDYSRKLVKNLTTFCNNTKCCQNLLLSAAALANISTMDPKSIKYLIGANTAKILLEAVRARGPRASIYLLEQIAILIANLSVSDAARKQLIEVNAPIALLGFLKNNANGEDIEKRLQQKSIIGLSRLCGDKAAAEQVVENGGIEKLVKLCREKQMRFDSDAVLVAALATLRKIVDACGTDILSVQDSQELVEPKLLDSFLAYSSQNESYV